LVAVSGTVLFLAGFLLWFFWMVSAQIASWAGSPRLSAILFSIPGFIAAYLVLIYGAQVI